MFQILQRTCTSLLIFSSCLLLATAESVDAEQSRIVTLGGSATEIVFALGMGDSVIGSERSSTYPRAVAKLPSVGYVRAISAEGVLALEPSMIIATSDLGPRTAVQKLQAARVEFELVSAPADIESLYFGIRHIGIVLDRTVQAEALIGELQAKYETLQLPAESPRALFFMQSGSHSGVLPAAGKGTKAEAFIKLSGGHNAITTHFGYKAISPEALLALDPDIIIIGVQEGSAATLDEVVAKQSAQPIWRNLRAVREGHLVAVPLGEALSFGPRLVDALHDANPHFVKSVAD